MLTLKHIETSGHESIQQARSTISTRPPCRQGQTPYLSYRPRHFVLPSSGRPQSTTFWTPRS